MRYDILKTRSKGIELAIEWYIQGQYVSPNSILEAASTGMTDIRTTSLLHDRKMGSRSFVEYVGRCYWI